MLRRSASACPGKNARCVPNNGLMPRLEFAWVEPWREKAGVSRYDLKFPGPPQISSQYARASGFEFQHAPFSALGILTPVTICGSIHVSHFHVITKEEGLQERQMWNSGIDKFLGDAKILIQPCLASRKNQISHPTDFGGKFK